MIAFLVAVVVVLVLLYVAKIIVDWMEIPAQIRTVVFLILGLIALLFLISQLGLLGPRVVVW